MIIERELMKTESTAATATSSHRHGCPTNTEVSSISTSSFDADRLSTAVTSCTAVKSVTGRDQESVPVNCDVSDGVVRDSRDRWQSPKSPTGLKKLQTKHTEALCTERQLTEEQPLCCERDPAVTVRKSDAGGRTSECDGIPAVHFVPQQTSSGSLVHQCAELTFKSAATLDGLCKSRLSSDEINNNCRRGCVGSVDSRKLGGNILGRLDAAVLRKSQRCNRGRRYHELMSNGAFYHHTSRKRSESLTM